MLRNCKKCDFEARKRQVALLAAKIQQLSARRVLFSRVSQDAFSKQQYFLAKELSLASAEASKAEWNLREVANGAAFELNNCCRDRGVIDLHDLPVQAALARLKSKIRLDLLDGESQLVVIVGKGRGSTGEKGRLKNAVVEYLTDEDFVHWVDKQNQGVVNVVY